MQVWLCHRRAIPVNFMGQRKCFLFELRAEEAGVKAVPGEEVVVPSLFDDLAVADDEDQIGVSDGGKAVGDDEARLAAHQRAHRRLDQQLGADVYKRQVRITALGTAFV